MYAEKAMNDTDQTCMSRLSECAGALFANRTALHRGKYSYSYIRKVNRSLKASLLFEIILHSFYSIVVHLSLITATLPRVHSYIAGFQAGLLDFQIMEYGHTHLQSEREKKGSFLSWGRSRKETKVASLHIRTKKGPILSLAPGTTNDIHNSYLLSTDTSTDKSISKLDKDDRSCSSKG